MATAAMPPTARLATAAANRRSALPIRPGSLAVGCYFNGMPGEAAHQKRLRAVLDALYEDLGLA